MGRRLSASSISSLQEAAGNGLGVGSGGGADSADSELQWPFGRLDSLTRDELRESAYEIFFTACRSTAGFSTRLTSCNTGAGDDGFRSGATTPMREAGAGGANMVVTSRVKRALGLRTRKAVQMRPMVAMAAVGTGKGKGQQQMRPMTSAEIMRRQMGVTEQSDHRLRKTLVRSQMSKKVDSVVLPLELLRHVEPSVLGDTNKYHAWQLRQLKILEAGLVLHPSVPLDRSNPAASSFREVMKSAEARPLDTGKNSDTMRTLCSSVMALAWRSVEVCHWMDGYPLNVHLYLSLLRAVFDLRDETVVLDEVDELLELIKKTWNMLGLNRMIHNVCFTWVLFEKYVVTGQVDPDLLSATLAMLEEVSSDAKKADREPGYIRVLSATLASMHSWAENKLLDYHEGFEKGAMGIMENVLSLALSAARILSEDVSAFGSAAASVVDNDSGNLSGSFAGNRVERYIKSSVRHAFTKLHETGNGKIDSMIVEVDEDPCETVMYLARQMEDLARVEKEIYSPVLRHWHPTPTAIAVVTVHNCFGVVLNQYVSKMAGLTNESVRVLHKASRLEKALVQMVVEDAANCEDGGKGVMKHVIPFEIDSIIFSLMKGWIDERLRLGAECIKRASESENWNPKSKAEPYAQSAVDLMKLAKVTVDEFFEIQVGAREELVQDLADGIDNLVHEYASLVASCGSKESYIPAPPPLRRCNQDSKLLQLWKKATPPCQVGMGSAEQQATAGEKRPRLVASKSTRARGEAHQPRPTTSRGTQRLYVRLNTLHYLLTILHSIDKALSFFGRAAARPSPSPHRHNPAHRRHAVGPTHFDQARATLQAAILHVSELSAYRLIFLDSAHAFHEALYQGGVAEARIRPTLRVLKQNLTFLVSVLSDRAQPLAVRELMKASFEAFLRVLLAGGSGRAFSRADYGAVAEDFACLKRLFCSCGEGLVAEEVVEREAAVAEGMVALMASSTQKLIDEFSSMARMASGCDQLPMPPMTGRWSRSDANTVLRVLCHRDEEAANRFLKKAFDLPKRR